MVSQESESASVTLEYSESLPGAPIEAVLCKDELDRRPSRPRDDEFRHTAIRTLIQGFSDSPQTVLQSLVDTILNVMQCDSAGISLINEERTRFYWPAIAGVWAQHVGGGTPIGFGPCGDVLAANRPLLMREIHKRYTYFTPVAWVKEVLLVPFKVDGQIKGTIWAVIHQPPNNERTSARDPEQYDREDLRLLEVLGDLATAAYQVWSKSKDADGATGDGNEQ